LDWTKVNMIDEVYIGEMLRLKGGHLYHREGQELEFKEQFNFAGLADYFRDFAAFANNRGGYIIFGVKDAPRVLIGLSAKSEVQFDKIDPEKITGYLLDSFSSDIRWEQALIKIDGMTFGVFRIYAAASKPVIARKNEGKDQVIKDGDVYYRYGGRTQKIQHAELESIISNRVEQNNRYWLDLMSKIGRAGPQNAAIMDTEKALIEKDDTRILVLDENLAEKIKFIKEGEFVEKDGAATLKLVGDVVPVDKIEVIKKIKERLTKAYPLAAMDLLKEVKIAVPSAKQNVVWEIIRENGMKENMDYSAYNFRNKRQEDTYEEMGELSASIPSIYNQAAVNFIVTVLKGQQEG